MAYFKNDAEDLFNVYICCCGRLYLYDLNRLCDDFLTVNLSFISFLKNGGCNAAIIAS